MKPEEIILSKNQLVDTLQWKAVLGFTLLTLVLPFIFHLLPAINGTPAGAMFLPIFYAPFVALLFYRIHVGLIAGISAPIINHLITGNPAWEIVRVLSIELCIFVIIAAILLKLTPKNFFAAPLAYVITKLVSMFILPILNLVPGDISGTMFFTNSVSNGFVGIILLGVVNFFALKMKNRFQAS
ncbi:MAG: hypothetical protein AAGI07_10170 [Bacteroidota bacterium]